MEDNQKKLSLLKTVRLNHRALRIWQSFCPGMFLSILADSVFRALSPYVTLWLSARIIDELAGGRDPEQLLKLVLIQLVSAALLSLFGGILGRWKNYKMDSAGRLHDRIYIEKMLRLDYADLDRQYVYDLYAQIRQNDNWNGWGLRYTLYLFEEIVTAVIRILGGAGLTVSLFLSQVPADRSGLRLLNHPLCMVLFIVLMLLTAVLSPVCAGRGSRYWSLYAPSARLGNRLYGFYGFMSEDRKRAEDCRMYRQQENVCDIYMKQNSIFGPASRIAEYARGPMGLWSSLSQCISVMLTIIAYLFVCLKAWAGAFGVGAVTQYIGAITRMFLGLSELLKNFELMCTNGEFLETGYEFLDIPNAMYQGSLTTEKRSDRKYEIEFRDVSFKYPGSSRCVLRHVNMKFRIGSRLAVVGMNGSGKTTFIKLLCRLYDPFEGQILLNGIDIRKYRYDDYIRLFSVVFQDFQLFSLPLGENVAGTPEYDRGRAEECLTHAGFSERMGTMPEGLLTYLYKDMDENGVDISGGEAQKIAIARALYKDAPFIILDEPTAALDPVAEMEIYSRFNDIAGDKTAVYISHRLSSCKFCDEIAVFHEGAVIQQGSHDKLVSDKEGKYYELWQAQAQYYASGNKK